MLLGKLRTRIVHCWFSMHVRRSWIILTKAYCVEWPYRKPDWKELMRERSYRKPSVLGKLEKWGKKVVWVEIVIFNIDR